MSDLPLPDRTITQVAEALRSGETTSRELTDACLERIDRHAERLNTFLARHGYTVAPFTVEHVDYLFSARYRSARLGKDDALAKKIGQAYLALPRSTRLVLYFGLTS